MYIHYMTVRYIHVSRPHKITVMLQVIRHIIIYTYMNVCSLVMSLITGARY